MQHRTPNISDELEALTYNFAEFYYKYQYDWLERQQINFNAIYSLYELIYAVQYNLELEAIITPEVEKAFDVAAKMEALARETVDQSEDIGYGMRFLGTREDYNRLGGELLGLLYDLETWVEAARAALRAFAKGEVS